MVSNLKHVRLKITWHWLSHRIWPHHLDGSGHWGSGAQSVGTHRRFLFTLTIVVDGKFDDTVHRQTTQHTEQYHYYNNTDCTNQFLHVITS